MFSFIVLSSDGYSDCWEPFFTLLLKNFPEVKKQEVILSTNFKDYSFNGLNIVTIKHGNVSWSKRFKDTLLKAENEIVFVVLEDFFLKSKIDFNRFSFYLNLMSKDSNGIDHIRMLNILKTNVVPSEFYGLEKIITNTSHRYVLMPGLWRKSSLMEYISEHESPYMNEVMGNLKSNILNHGFYTISRQLIEEEGNFYNSATAGAIYKGKWAKWVPNFFTIENIAMDFTLRGFRTKEYRKMARFKTRMGVLIEPRSLLLSLKSLTTLILKNGYKW